MKIKYCGLRRMEDVEYANRTRPDYVGFVFAPTRRQVTMEFAAQMKERLHPAIGAVGVFVDEAPEVVAEIANRGIIDIIQLHGQEDEAYLEKLRGLLAEPRPVIKAVRVRSKEDIQEGQRLSADYLLLDKYDAEKLGGTGEKFDWSLVGEMSKPFFLAGGIDMESLPEAAAMQPFGIDVSSGIETDGVKDFVKMQELMTAFRSLNQ